MLPVKILSHPARSIHWRLLCAAIYCACVCIAKVSCISFVLQVVDKCSVIFAHHVNQHDYSCIYSCEGLRSIAKDHSCEMLWMGLWIQKKNGVGNELTFGICLVCMPPLLLPSLLSEKLSRRESREGTTYGNSFTVYLNILRMYYILVEHHNHTGTLVHCCFW